MDYLFTSERLGFRKWDEQDLLPMTSINQDPEVMKYFPYPINASATAAFINRMNAQYDKSGYCYFAVDRLDDSTLIGFIGLSYQDYELPFAPFVDIGWRLAKAHWNKGYATEGAMSCMNYALKTLQISKVYSIAPLVNAPSIHVMKKIGMSIHTKFKHPLLGDYLEIEECVAYLKQS